jgi:D-alanyl-D-alanine carboxypeptidase
VPPATEYERASEWPRPHQQLRRLFIICFAIIELATWAGEAQAVEPSSVDRSERDGTAAALSAPMAIYILSDDGHKVLANGMAGTEAGQSLGIHTPVRIASNTKTFTAATVLRLWETGRVDLDAPIAALVAPELDRLLRSDGYDPDRITVRQLLSHSAGLFDHASDPRFAETFMADPGRVWTPSDLLGLMTEYGDPRSVPGIEFSYSDDGYILLGNIIERITGKSLASAVREELGFSRIGVLDTWWEILEEPPAGVVPRTRQWIGNREVTNVHASVDLFGGGGLLMSARDMAIFWKALFEGKIFAQPGTLDEMLRQGSHKGSDRYRLGMFAEQFNGRTFYWHSGFWGTYALYDPATRTAVAGVTTQQLAFRDLVAIARRQVQGLESQGTEH